MNYLAHEQATLKRQLATVAAYRPFIVGLLVIFVGTYGLAVVRPVGGAPDIQRLMNIFMGLSYIVFAVPKLWNVSAFARTFRKYDLISKRFGNYALAFPFIELGLGLVLLSGSTTGMTWLSVLVNSIVALLSGLGVVSVLRSLRKKQAVDCACMGAAFKIPLSKVAVAENGIMLCMALIMLATMRPAHMMMATLMLIGAAGL